jgi:hypothetical protein
MAALERVKMGVRAQAFLDVLQGAFQSTWADPETLTQAMSEVSGTDEAKPGLQALLSYLEALSPCLSRLCEVRGREGEGGLGRQGKGRSKRGDRGGGVARSSVEEKCVDEEAASEQDLGAAALGQEDEMDNDASEAGGRRGKKAALLGGLVRPGVPPSRFNMAHRQHETSMQGVLADKDLLEYVFGFVGGKTARQSAKALGQVALVSRLWREECSRKDLWKGVEREVVPALWREEQGGRVAVGRGRLVQYGRQLLAERRVWSVQDWAAGLELHVEVFDRMDGLQMLSARGPLLWRVMEGSGWYAFSLPPLPAVEVRGSSFSAASRDPEQRRFADIGAYFSQGHRSEYPCSLCVRMTVRDQRTGKGGLLWEEGKGAVRVCENVVPYWEQRLPEGAKAVWSRKSSMVGAQGGGEVCWTTFFVCPEPGQEGVAEEDRLYHVALGADNSEGDTYPSKLLSDCMDIVKIGSIIRSLC